MKTVMLPEDKEKPTQEELRNRITVLKGEIREHERAAKKSKARADENRETAIQTGGFFGRVTIRAFLGSGLYEKSRTLWNKWSRWVDGDKDDWPREATRDFLASLLSRFTRLGVFAGLVAIAPLIFIGTQTWLLCNQNRLLDAQNNLVESNRRSALTFELSAILNKMNRELDAHERFLASTRWKSIAGARKAIQKKLPGPEVKHFRQLKRNEELFRRMSAARLKLEVFPGITAFSIEPSLSPRLKGRIIALNKVLRPYRYLDETGRLMEKSLSPERGQLLIALVESGAALSDMLSRQSFAYADLTGTSVSRSAVGQSGGYAGTNLTHLDLRGARLDGAKFNSVVMEFANLRNAEMRKVQFRKAFLENAKFNAAKLEGAFFKDPFLRYANFNGADLTNAKFHAGDLREVKFTGAILKNTAFCMSVMPRCKTEGKEAKHLAADFSSVIFQGAIVYDKDWLKCLAQVGRAPGADVIKKLEVRPWPSSTLERLEGASLLPKTMYMLKEKGVEDLPCFKTSDELNRN